MFSTGRVGKKGKLGIWHITESLDALLKLKGFSKEDLAKMESLTYEHRKKEWLVARILTEELTGAKDAQIVYDQYNKPSIQGSKKHISLSHSHDLLAVILDDADTGIDIELIKPKIEKIKHKFMSDAELKALQVEKQEEQLTVYWCAKESLYKLYGKKELEFKTHLIIDPFQLSESGNIKGWIKKSSVNRCLSLQYEKLNLGHESYMLAYIINQD